MVFGSGSGAFVRLRMVAAALLLALGATGAQAACPTSLDFGGTGVGATRTLDMSGCSDAIRSSGLFSSTGKDAYQLLAVPGTTNVLDLSPLSITVLDYLINFNGLSIAGLPDSMKLATFTLANGAQVSVKPTKTTNYLVLGGGGTDGFFYDEFTFTIVSLGNSSSSIVPLYYASSAVKLQTIPFPDPVWTTNTSYPITLNNMAFVPTTPTVTSVSPTRGAATGGTTVTITGTNLSGASAVKFGATDASSFTIVSATQITATAPAGTAGTVDITVTTSGGTSATSAADQFTYVAAPTVTALSPTQGSVAGGTVVTITGTNLTGATAVNFGASAASSFTVNSATQITATAPAGTAGTVDVRVTTLGGTSATSAADQFQYGAVPTIANIRGVTVPYNAGAGAASSIDAAALGSVTGSPTSYSIPLPPSALGVTQTISPSGVISYTPPVGVRGMDIFLVQATNGFGSSTPASVEVTIGDPTFAASAAPTAATYNQSYDFTLGLTGGKAPYSAYSATGLPPGLTMDATGRITGTPTAAGTYSSVIVTATDSSSPAYTGSTAALMMTVDKATQTITFDLPPTLFMGFDLPIFATASSGLTVSLTSTTTAVCTVSGTTLTPVSTGTCTIEATQAGDANTAAAAKVTKTLDVQGQTQTISFTNPGTQVFGTTLTLSATATSGRTVTFASSTLGVCTVSGTTLTFVGTGICSIDADQAAGGVYAAAARVSQSFTVSAADQTITFANPGRQSFGTTPTLSATTDSGLAVTFTSTSAICSVAGTTLSFTGTGTCTIYADQAGNANYNAAAQVSQSFAVGPGTQSITFAQPADQTYGTPLPVAATATSGLTVAFTSASTDVCTVAGTTVTFVKSGTCDIRANQAGDANYDPATEVARTFAVDKAAQTITFANPGTQTYGTSPTVTASADSTLAPSFTSATSGVCTVTSQGALTFLTSGTCTINADQAGDDRYAAAPQVARSFTVTAAGQVITFANPGTQVMATTPTLTATSDSGLTVTFSALTATCSITPDGVLTPVSAGTCTIAADQAGDGRFTPAAQVTQSFTIDKAVQQASVSTPTTVALNDTGTVTVTTAPGLTPTFSSLTSAVCDVSVTGAITPKSTGTCTVQVDIPGDATYQPYSVQRSFTVTVQNQSIDFPDPGPQKLTATPTLTATATSRLPVLFTGNSPAVCTVSPTGTLTFIAAGSCSVTASQAGDATHAAATSVTRSFAVIGADPDAQEALVADFQTARATAVATSQPDLLSFLLTPDAEGTFGLSMSSMGGDLDLFQKPGPVWVKLVGNVTTGSTGAPDHYAGLSFGTHRHIGAETIVGIMATVDSMRMTQALGFTEGTGWMAGPYFVSRLGQAPLYLETRFMAGRTNESVTQAGLPASDVTGDQHLLTVKIAGKLKAGDATLMPNLSLFNLHQSTDPYTAAGGAVVPSVVSDYNRVAIGVDGALTGKTATGEMAYSGGLGLFVSNDSNNADGVGLTYSFGMNRTSDDLTVLNFGLNGQSDLANGTNTLGLTLAYKRLF